MNKTFGFVVLAVAAGCGTLVGCKKTSQEAPKASYSLMKVQTSDQTTETSYPASIKGRQDIEIYPQVSGYITSLCVTEGQKVKKGETLFIIDQVPYQAALRTAEANVAAAKASLATAQLTYNSKKALFDKKVVSSFDLQTSENDLLTAKASLAQAEANEVTARNNLSYTVVKSPADGVVGTLPYRVGTLASSNLQLTTVSDNSEMYVYFSLNENQILELTRQYGSADSVVKNMPELQLLLNDGSTYPIKGKLETISGVIETGVVNLRAVFSNPDRLLYSGASGTILIPTVHKNCIIIPQGATVQLQDKYITYKVVDGKAVSTPIEVAPNNDGKTYVVTSGLKVGDEIVSEGAGLIREGTQVK